MAARVGILSVTFALCLVGPAAGANAFSDVVFFGDSFTDTGNNGPIDNSAALPAIYGYDPDRWTNAGGTLWVDDFGAADPNALYVVWAAGNDLLQRQDAASTLTVAWWWRRARLTA